jgi:hypothetical protein
MNDRKINDEGGIDWGSMIEGCGLSVDGKLSDSEVINPSRAVLAVAGGYIQPEVSVRRESATAMESLDT